MLRLHNHSELSFFKMLLALLSAIPNLLNEHSKYGGSCPVYIIQASCVALGAYMIKYTNSHHILNYH
jgi:hypothetical protein